MSERRGFRLDAKSLGLTTSNLSGTQCTEEEPEQKLNLISKQEMDKIRTKLEKKRMEMQSKRTQFESEVTTYSSRTTTISAAGPTNLESAVDDSELLSTAYYKGQVNKFRDMGGDGPLMCYDLNTIFVKRLDAIESATRGNVKKNCELLLATYQNWVDLLLQVNFVVFGNLCSLENESYAKILTCLRTVRGEEHQVMEENRKLRKDLCAIIKLVQEAYHHNNWNTDNLCLDTLSVNQLLGVMDNQPRPESESEKVNKCTKSLANEVAAKHDEVCYLQTQLSALDEIVLTARQKLILKDKCIAQLNQQLVELQDTITKMSKDNITEIEAVHALNVTEATAFLQELNNKDMEANELLHTLDIEIMELKQLNEKKDFEDVESRSQMIATLIDRINKERCELIDGITNLRRHMRTLLTCHPNAVSQIDLPLNDDSDKQLIQMMRMRLVALQDLNMEAQRKHGLIKKEYEELSDRFEAEKNIRMRTGEILKEITDQISVMHNVPISFEQMFRDREAPNPFCAAIADMFQHKAAYESLQMENRSNHKSDTKTTCHTTTATTTQTITMSTTTNSTT